MIKKLLTIFGIISLLGLAPVAYALPDTRFEQNIKPFTTNLYDLGDTSLRWQDLYMIGNLSNSSMSDGCASWVSGILTSLGVPCGSGGGGSSGGTWSTTTSQDPSKYTNYSNNDTDIVTIGSSSTTTSEFYFDPNTSRALIPYASSTAVSLIGWPLATSTVVCKAPEQCKYNTIQSALTAGALYIHVKPGVYSEQLTIQSNKTVIEFENLNAILQCNGVTQSPCITSNAKDEWRIFGGTIRETNANLNGIAFDYSNSAKGWMDGTRINNFSTSTYGHDSTNNTFYNKFTNVDFHEPRSCIDLGGSQANENIFMNVQKCRPQAVDGGVAVYVSDGRGLSFTNVGVEGTTTGKANIGWYFDATSRDNKVDSTWTEAIGTGVVIASGANNIIFSGGSVTSNGTDISDSGTKTRLLGINRTGTKLFNIASATSTDFAITNLATPAGAFLAVAPDGSIRATTTPSSGSGSSAGNSKWATSTQSGVTGIFANNPNDSIYIGDTVNLQPNGFGSGFARIQTATSSNDIEQWQLINRSTGTSAAGCMFLVNDRSTLDTIGAASNYYGGTCFGGSQYNLPGFNALRANGIGLFATDGPVAIGSGSANAASSSIYFQAGSGLDANYDMILTGGAGFLGIGTTTPYAKLSVVGQAVAEYFTATSTTATSTFINAVQGKMIDSGGFAYDVRAFGAKCNGITDDATAIQNTLNAATTSGTIYFPKGTCIVGTTLKFFSGQHLVGQGGSRTFANQTLLFYTGALNTPLLQPNDVTRNTENVVIRDMFLHGNALANPIIDWNRVSYSQVSNVGIYNPGSGGHLVLSRASGGSSYFTTWSNMYFLQGLVTFTDGSNSNQIIDSTFTNSTTSLEINGLSSGNTFSGNDFELQSVQNVYVDATRNSFIANRMENAPIGYRLTSNATYTNILNTSYAGTVTKPVVCDLSNCSLPYRQEVTALDEGTESFGFHQGSTTLSSVLTAHWDDLWGYFGTQALSWNFGRYGTTTSNDAKFNFFRPDGLGTRTAYVDMFSGNFNANGVFTSASTTAASTFPYASSTALTVSGNTYLSNTANTRTGIGTTTPQVRLDVQDTNTTVFRTVNYSTNGGSQAQLACNDKLNCLNAITYSSAYTGGSVFSVGRNGTALDVTGGTLAIGSTGVDGALQFFINNTQVATFATSTTGTARGNFGISSTTPGTLLSIGNTNGINFTLASSTFSTSGGINLIGGCFAINGVCLSGSSSSSFAYPFTTTTTYATTTAATTTPLWLQGNKFSLFASSTSVFDYASTTALSATTICLTGDTCRTTWPSGGTTVYTGNLAVETPSGTVNGSNVTFTAVNTPILVTVDGQTMSSPDDMSISGTTITFVTAPGTGGVIRSYYATQNSSSGVFSATADKVVTNTVSDTSVIPSGVGTITLPANFLSAGRTVHIHGEGLYECPALGCTATVKIKYGATTLATKNTTGLLSTGSRNPFTFDAYVQTRTAGGSGTVVVQGIVTYASSGGLFVSDYLNNSGVASTIDTTASSALDVTLAWDSAVTTKIATTTIATYNITN